MPGVRGFKNSGFGMHKVFFCYVDVCLLKGGFFGWILIFLLDGYVRLRQTR
jgi:hypothetical protein